MAESGLGIALVGYRGSGKSTVGRLLAERLGRPFVDVDAEFEARAGRPIAAYFAERGEPAFRDEEERLLGELARQYPHAVISTGGGAVLRPGNRAVLRRLGFVAWLAARPEVLGERLRAQGAENRPALTTRGTLEEIAEVLAAREPHYREVADAIVSTDTMSPAEAALAVLSAYLMALSGREEGSAR